MNIPAELHPLIQQFDSEGYSTRKIAKIITDKHGVKASSKCVCRVLYKLRGKDESGADKRAHRPPVKSAPRVAARVTTIRDLMLSNKWQTSVTNQELAQQWGVEVATVDKAASEASRQIMAALGDATDVRVKICLALEESIALARQDKSPAPLSE